MISQNPPHNVEDSSLQLDRPNLTHFLLSFMYIYNHPSPQTPLVKVNLPTTRYRHVECELDVPGFELCVLEMRSSLLELGTIFLCHQCEKVWRSRNSWRGKCWDFDSRKNLLTTAYFPDGAFPEPSLLPRILFHLLNPTNLEEPQAQAKQSAPPFNIADQHGLAVE